MIIADPLAADDEPVPITKPVPARLLPLISELKILTKDKQVARLGDVMNYAQLDFVRRCEEQLATRGQIRIVVLKARQIGISTIIEAINFVLAMLYDDFKAKIVSHEKDSATGILEMTKRYWDTYAWKKHYTEKYNGLTHLSWTNKSDINVSTAANAKTGRSLTIHSLHASEVGFWPDPETLMTGLDQSIPTFGLNCIFLESTANGVGNYFHKKCTTAMKGESEYEFVFYPWHEHPEYTAAYVPEDSRQHYNVLGPLTEEEIKLREQFGLSDARLIWRRWAIQNKCQGDINKFHQEYPSTPHEAFISTGLNVFPLEDLIDHYVPRKGKRGVLVRQGNKVVFQENRLGWFTMFAEPSVDRDWGIYLCGADPTHTTAGDYACIQVINRRTLEQVGVYRRKIDPINFGKDLQLVGTYYNTALVAPEKTGPGYATVGCIVADNYYNVFTMTNVAKMPGKPVGEDLAGWMTSEVTKHLAISHLKKLVLDPVIEIGGQKYGLVIHDEVTLLEMRDYVTTKSGGYENSDGSDYDDGVMAFAIAVTAHAIEPPPPAYTEALDMRVPRKGPVKPGITAGHALVRDNAPRDTPVGGAPEGREQAPWEAWDVPREGQMP